MANVVVTTIIDRPISVVWEEVARLENHVEWMADAVAIRFVTEARSGVGVTFECDTRIGRLRTTDVMEIVDWDEGHRIGVRHVGAVSGDGAFTLHPLDDQRTEFRWEETLSFPWWLGGRVGGYLARPALAALWRRNLARLRRRLHAL